MKSVVVMPRLGESIVEGTIARWCVKIGDLVQRGQTLAEVETDKATNDLPAPKTGTVAALLFPEGTTVDVGTAILELEETGAVTAAPTAPTVSAPAAPTSAPVSSPSAPGRLPTQHLLPQLFDPRGGPTRSSPAVRRLAREHGINLLELKGTGAGGRVTRDDVLKSLELKSTATVSVPATETVLPAPMTSVPEPSRRPTGYRPPVYRPRGNDKVVPFSRRRELIADHMISSLQTSAHVAAVAEIDLWALQKTKSVEAPVAEAAGVKLTILPYVVRAVARALAEYPQLNASVVDRSLVLRSERNLGIAVDTEEGLVVPVVHRADELTLIGLARRMEELAQKARAGTLTGDDLAGGSFTISNPGKDGNLFGISIIRQPEVAILRIGSVVKRPVVREIDGEDVIVVRPIMYAALSYDHRVIDGRTGNAFLRRVTQLLQTVQPAN